MTPDEQMQSVSAEAIVLQQRSLHWSNEDWKQWLSLEQTPEQLEARDVAELYRMAGDDRTWGPERRAVESATQTAASQVPFTHSPNESAFQQCFGHVPPVPHGTRLLLLGENWNFTDGEIRRATAPPASRERVSGQRRGSFLARIAQKCPAVEFRIVGFVAAGLALGWLSVMAVWVVGGLMLVWALTELVRAWRRI